MEKAKEYLESKFHSVDLDNEFLTRGRRSLSDSFHGAGAVTTTTSTTRDSKDDLLGLDAAINSSFIKSDEEKPISNISTIVVYKGYLLKKGHYWKSWKKRYFILNKVLNNTTGTSVGLLQYYKNSSASARLRGEITLTNDPVSVRFLDIQKSKRAHCFEVVKGFYSLMCQGRDEQDVHMWVHHIQNTIFSSTNTVFTSDKVAMPPRRTVRSQSLDESHGHSVASELSQLLDNPRSPEGIKCSQFVKNFDARGSDSIKNLKSFLTSTRELILKRHNKTLVRIMMRNSFDTSEAQRAVNKAISRKIEEKVFIPLHDSLYSFLKKKISSNDEALLNKKLKWLQGKEQAFFGIPREQTSWDNWKSAVASLVQMGSYSLPSDKLEALTSTIRRIKICFEEIRDSSSSSSSYYNNSIQHEDEKVSMLDDDIVPIFAFALVNSGVDNLLTLKELVYTMSEIGEFNPDGKLSQDLKLLAASIKFIQGIVIPSAFEDIFNTLVVVTIEGNWEQGLEFEVERTFKRGAIIKRIKPDCYEAIGTLAYTGDVLVSVSGTNVVLWSYKEIIKLLRCVRPPVRLSFIDWSRYIKIVRAKKHIWNDALVLATKLGLTEDVKSLLRHGADVNCCNDDGNSPIHIAASIMHVEMLSCLILEGAKCDLLGADGRTALHMVGDTTRTTTTTTADVVIPYPSSNVCEIQNVQQVVDLLLKQHGTIVNSLDDFGYTPLMLLAKQGLIQGVESLLKNNATVDLRNWINGETALSLAASGGHTKTVRLLLSYNADPNIPDLRYETPLHRASAIACAKTCQVLLEKSAVVNARNLKGITPLLVAVSLGRCTCGVLLEENIHVDTSSVLQTINILLRFGGKVDGICSLYRTSLHYGAMHGGPEVVQLLLNRGADPNANDINNETALDLVETLMNGNYVKSRRDSSRWKNWDSVQSMLAPITAPKSDERLREYSNIFVENVEGNLTLRSGDMLGILNYALTSSLTGDKIFLWISSSKHFQSKAVLEFLNERLVAHGMENITTKIIRTALWFALCWAEYNQKQHEEFAHVIEKCFLNADSTRVLEWWSQSSFSVDLSFAKTESNSEERSSFTERTLSSFEFPDESSTIGRFLADLEGDLEKSVNIKPRYSAISIAQQLTLVQHYFYRRISALHIYSKDTSGMYNTFKKLHNRISLWTLNQILECDDITKRVVVLELIIKTAGKLFDPLRNFDGFMAIMNALNDTSIFRLKLLWANLSPKTWELWQTLNAFTLRGARSLDTEVRNAKVPYIPYIGLVMRNISMFRELPEFSTKISNDNEELPMLNFNKIRSVGKAIDSIRQSQGVPYFLNLDTSLVDWLFYSCLRYPSKDDCYNRSLEIKARI